MYLYSMIREIITYGSYYDDFIATVSPEVKKKIHYVFDILCTKEIVSKKFVDHIRDGIYEIRIEYAGNIYRILFIFDEGKIVVLFNGFQKKTQKLPENELQKAIKIRKEYYEYKQNQKHQ